MHDRRIVSVSFCAAIALFAASQAIASSTFTVAGFTFDQNSTPDQISSLTGAPFTAGGPTTITQSVAFAAQSIGGGGVITPKMDNEAVSPFVPELSIGELAFAAGFAMQSGGGDGHYATALNMPNGNNGTTIRHGIEASWSTGSTLANLSGDDFAIYESGSNASSPEGFMVRARLATGGFTNWFYQTNNGYELYLGEAAEGAFMHAFDLSDMGLAPGDLVSGIQIANLIAADTLGGVAGGTRQVFLGGGGGSGHGLATGALDPDPLYVGITSGHLIPEPASAVLAMFGLGACLLRRRR